MTTAPTTTAPKTSGIKITGRDKPMTARQTAELIAYVAVNVLGADKAKVVEALNTAFILKGFNINAE